MVNAVLVGFGAVARNYHLPALVAARGVSLSAVIDLDPDVAAGRLATLLAAPPPVYSTLGEVPRGVDLDIAVLATPPIRRFDMIAGLLERGLDVICEKPLALSVDEAERIVAQAEASSRLIATSFQKRFYPASLMVSKALMEEWVGRPQRYTLVEAIEHEWGADTLDLYDPGKVMGGVLYTSGIHWVDRILHWLGPAEVDEATHDARGGVEANMKLTCRHTQTHGTVFGRMVFSWTENVCRRLVVHCDQGRIIVDDANPGRIGIVTTLGEGRQIELQTPEAPVNDAFLGQLEDFLQTRGGKLPTCATGVDGLNALRFIRQAYDVAVEEEAAWQHFAWTEGLVNAS